MATGYNLNASVHIFSHIAFGFDAASENIAWNIEQSLHSQPNHMLSHAFGSKPIEFIIGFVAILYSIGRLTLFVCVCDVCFSLSIYSVSFFVVALLV